MATRRTRAEWMRLVEEWRHSGVGPAEFCRLKRLSRNTFLWWRWQLGASHRDGAAQRAGLVSVEVVRATPALEPIEVVLGNGATVRVPVSFDRDALARVLAVVAGMPPC